MVKEIDNKTLGRNRLTSRVSGTLEKRTAGAFSIRNISSRATSFPNAVRLGRKTDSLPTSNHGIAFRAWEIWNEEGRPKHREIEHWLRAEEELLPRRVANG